MILNWGTIIAVLSSLSWLAEDYFLAVGSGRTQENYTPWFIGKKKKRLLHFYLIDCLVGYKIS